MDRLPSAACAFLPLCAILMLKGGRAMESRVVELYDDAAMTRLERRIRLWRGLLWALAAVALAACLGMIARTGTANAARMELTVICVSTFAGWIVLYGRMFGVTAARRELAHANMLRREERQAVSGGVTVTNERVAIRNSITARRVEVTTDGQTRRLLVCETRAEALASAGATVLYTAHSYVAAYEVTP